MNKLVYETPEMEINCFDAEDIICTSDLSEDETFQVLVPPQG